MIELTGFRLIRFVLENFSLVGQEVSKTAQEALFFSALQICTFFESTYQSDRQK